MDYRGALEAFKKAYFNYEEPTLLFNIAQCHRYLGQKAEAVVSYRNFLRKSPNSPMADEVRKLITQLEGAIEQERKANNAPPSGTLTPGAAPNQPPRKETPPPVVESKPPEPATTQVTVSARPSDTPLIKKWWLWTAVGGGVVVLALGIGLGVGLSGGESPYPSTGAGTVFRF